jgi:hypothetical protein
MHEALGSSPSTEKNKIATTKKGDKEKCIFNNILWYFLVSKVKLL